MKLGGAEYVSSEDCGDSGYELIVDDCVDGENESIVVVVDGCDDDDDNDDNDDELTEESYERADLLIVSIELMNLDGAE